MKAITIKQLKQGDYFTLKPIECPTERQVWIRGSYERGCKKFSVTKFSDICHESFHKGDRVVYTDFIF